MGDDKLVAVWKLERHRLSDGRTATIERHIGYRWVPHDHPGQVGDYLFATPQTYQGPTRRRID
jgi:hypothetical protein